MKTFLICLATFWCLFVSAQEDRAGHYLKKASEQGRTAIRLQVAAIACFAASPVPAIVTSLNGKPNYVGTIILSAAGLGFGIGSLVTQASAWNSINEAGDRLRIGLLPSGRFGVACQF